METKINILKEFFEDPNKEFHIRELARILKTNHTKVRNYLNKLLKENYLKIKKDKIYSLYKANINKKFLNLKLYYNLEKIRKSKIMGDLEKFYDFPAIVLFGSYSQAVDDKKSDIDIFILSDIKEKFNTKKYKKILKKEISIHLHSKKEFEKLKINSKEFINSLCNGIILSGQLEVLK
ncbi:nucleotidyltransferase domain-containing protein [Candidatus Pacearchaeota archaeon]|nr:nucleotidyltransferase domain-containing protein [Candidatus Pacearchaeota archaeon]